MVDILGNERPISLVDNLLDDSFFFFSVLLQPVTLPSLRLFPTMRKYHPTVLLLVGSSTPDTKMSKATVP